MSLYSIIEASRPYDTSAQLQTHRAFTLRSLTRPLRNMLTFLNLISALAGGVTGFLAAVTVCRIFPSSSAQLDLPPREAHLFSERSYQIRLLILWGIHSESTRR